MAVQTETVSSKSSVPIAYKKGELQKLGVSGVIAEIVKYLLLLALAVCFAFPFYWMMASALKDDPQIYTVPPIWIPNPAHWENFWNGWNVRNFNLFAINTIVRFAIPSTVGTVFSSAFIAYGFSRLRWPGRDVLFFICITTMMVPYQVVMVPLFIIFKQLDWINTYRPLVVPAFFGSPYFIFMLRQFFLTIPQELSDAARIDGASEFGILWHVILPLAKPALAVVALFQFIWAWNEYLGPLIYINQERLFPIALGLQALQRALNQSGFNPLIYPHLMAVSTIITIPIVIFFFLTQRTFIEGISLTGLKG
ncbi:MAG: carbohydrate ABC transporter permease [Anaerolineae bacterium]|nr:carbohydrate ABC transporter permease [Anaerolineae bacterium]